MLSSREEPHLERHGSRQLRLAHFEEQVYMSGLHMRRHGHEQAVFTIFLAGGYEETVGDEVRHVNSLRVIYHPPDEEHSVRFGPLATRLLRVALKGSTVRLAREASLPTERPQVLHTESSRWLAVKLLREFRSPSPSSVLNLEAALLELLAELGKAEGSVRCKDCVKTACDYIQAHCSRTLSLSEIAAAAGVHPVTLAKSFRKSLGCTVGDYQRYTRLEMASNLLRGTSSSVAEVAAEAGFADQAHLARVFKKATSLTPSQYRRTYCGG